ncbi:MAG: glycerophosphodiester phosphodiesterase family protein [Candidatus Eremiobacterota bacterium]
MIKTITASIFLVIFLFSQASGKEKTLSIAHRGGADIRPENTMSAFENAINIGADYIELDVHLSKDGVPVVIHDSGLERTTDGKGKVEDKTLEELKKLDCGKWFSEEFRGEKISALEEVMELVKGKIKLAIEIKNCKDLDDGIEEKIITLAGNHDMLQDIIIISFSYDRIKKVNELDGSITTGFLYGGSKRDVCKMAIDAGIDYICPHWMPVTEELIKEAHSYNLRVNIWTVNNPALMKKFIDMGADAITTDRPDYLLEELKK